MKVKELSNTDLYHLLKMIDLQIDSYRTNMMSQHSTNNRGSNVEWQELTKKRTIITNEIKERINNIE